MGAIKNRHNLRNVEFIRILFAVGIVYFHLLHSFIMPYTGEAAVYRELALQSRYAKYIVECFFIMSGYFLYRSIQKKPDQDTWDFIVKKIIRLWPVLAVSTVLSVVFLGSSLQDGFLNLFFLQSTGLTTAWTGLNWYVSAFFFAEVFYFLLSKSVKNTSVMNFVICILVYLGYVLNIVYTDGGFARKVVYGIFSLAMARAVAGVGLGYLLGLLYDRGNSRYGFLCGEKKMKNAVTAIISFIELGSFVLLMIDFFAGKKIGKNQFIVVILFSLFFLCMLTEKGVFSRLISCISIWKLGKYAYSIYIMQEFGFFVLKNTLWKNKEFICCCPGGALVLSTAVVVLIGVLTYYVVERPVNRIGSKIVVKCTKKYRI